MSHIPVGERLAGMNPQMVGHVVRGAGHFIEQGNGMVQEFARHLPEIPYIVARSLPDLTDPATWNRWQWDTLASNYGNGSVLAGSNHESSAAEKYVRDFFDHPSIKNNIDCLSDAGLAIGSFLAGDMENAVGYGQTALEKGVNGTLRDFGLIGGWGDYGGVGTWQPTGAGRDH